MKTVKVRRNLGLADCPACDGIGKTRIRRVLKDGRIIGPDGRTREPWCCESCGGSGKVYKTELIEAKPGQSIKLDEGRVYVVDANGSLRRADKLSIRQLQAIRERVERIRGQIIRLD